MKLFVTAAWDPELQRFREVTPPDIATAAVGIGLVDATAGMTQCIVRHSPSHVVLLGTAGAAPGGDLRIGDVVVGRVVRLVDPAVVQGLAAIPFGAVEVPLATEPASWFIRAGAKPVTVANTLAITTDDALAERLAAVAQVEHLEAFGVARACELSGVEVSVVLGIANIVGSSGRAEWRDKHLMASARAAEVAARGISDWLASVRSG